jgi:hypothetical protein
MAEIGNARPRDKAHIARADHRNPHGRHSSNPSPPQTGVATIIIALFADQEQILPNPVA